MKKGNLIRILFLGMVVGAGSAYADETLIDFNGTGFDYRFGTWDGNTTPGASAVEISATEMGGAGIGFAPVDLFGLDIALTAKLGAGNLANELQGKLVDENNQSLLLFFPTSAFNEFTMNTLALTPSVPGGFDITKVKGFELTGDFGSGDNLHVFVDNVAAVSPVAIPEASSFSMFGLGLLGMLVALRRQKNAA